MNDSGPLPPQHTQVNLNIPAGEYGSRISQLIRLQESLITVGIVKDWIEVQESSALIRHRYEQPLAALEMQVKQCFQLM